MDTPRGDNRTAASQPQIIEGIHSMDLSIRELRVQIPVEHMKVLDALAEAHGLSTASLARLVIRASLETQVDSQPASLVE